MSKYIFSTLTASQKYPIWIRTPGRDMPTMQSYVRIQGGANLPSKVFVTPLGVMTVISDDEFERVTQCPGFQQHVDNGFLIVEDHPYELDSVIEDMEAKDSSAPMVPEDFEAEGLKAPSVAAVDQSEIDSSRVGATQRSSQAATQLSEEKAKAEKVKAEKKKPATDTAASAINSRRRRGRPRKTDA